MTYLKDYKHLKNIFNQEDECIDITKQIRLFNFPFNSLNYRILPGKDEYFCKEHKLSFLSSDKKIKSTPEIHKILDVSDSDVLENRHFKYSIFMPKGKETTKNAILLLHGLNEKYWYKYLPWAKKLVELTGKAVILFPITFHMNRAPLNWSNTNLMNDIRCEREKVFPEIISSSFANIAISARLHSLPQRFFWSGVETFYDIIHLLRNIKSGKHPLIEKESIIDIFSYSVGAFLAEILMLSNTGNYFDNAKLFIFAGGPVFNRMSPVSKYIIDSKANMAIYSFFIEHLENHLKKDKRLAHYFGESHPEGKVFKCMLNYNKMKSFREEKIRSMSERIEAIALSKDTVVPPYEVINTLKGESRKIPVKVRIIDFPYFYCHENPFPINEKNIIGVNNSFNRVMRYAANFLK